jgi:hypothetical protein
VSKPGNTDVRFPDDKERRDRLRAAGVCINGLLPDELRKRFGNYSRVVVHGPVVRHGKCQHCLDVHAKTC